MRQKSLVLGALFSALMGYRQAAAQSISTASGGTGPAHVRSSFQFTLRAPLERAAPLFGPEGERCWAGPHWNPVFLYPQPAKDMEGAVFTVEHRSGTSVWINTRFDLAEGRVQYVSFVPEALVSTVDVRLSAVDAKTTHVEVTYVRTAVSAAVNEHVNELAARDGASGPEWQRAIKACLEQTRR